MEDKKPKPFERELKQCSVEVNTLYMMSLAMDIIMRHNETVMGRMREAWKREKKQLFTRYSKAVRDACILQDMLTQDIYDCDEKHNYKNVDVWLEEANELARLVLLFADRSVDEEAVNGIFKHVRSVVGEGIVDEEMLKSFYLK
jgi:hypothetical protein